MILPFLTKHKIPLFLLFLLLLTITTNWHQTILPTRVSQSLLETGLVNTTFPGVEKTLRYPGPIPPGGDYAPAPEVADRLVVQQSSLSLLVTNVREAADTLIAFAKSNGGYMVESSFHNPGESPNGTVTLRIPSKSLEQALTFFRSVGLRVVSENLQGTDVTDQYVDIESRLATLYKTQQKFEQILEQATRVEDILRVQKELTNLQAQIDAFKGQQQYLAKTAELAKVTIYLATDEFELPFAPSDAWRPQVIFKQAVRSLVSTIRSVGTLLIWGAVYSVVLIPIGIGILWYRRKKRNLTQLSG